MSQVALDIGIGMFNKNSKKLLSYQKLTINSRQDLPDLEIRELDIVLAAESKMRVPLNLTSLPSAVDALLVINILLLALSFEKNPSLSDISTLKNQRDAVEGVLQSADVSQQNITQQQLDLIAEHRGKKRRLDDIEYDSDINLDDGMAGRAVKAARTNADSAPQQIAMQGNPNSSVALPAEPNRSEVVAQSLKAPKTDEMEL